MSKYVVNIDMVWSQSIEVNAKNTREAKKKAFEKFKQTKIKPKNFNISSDKIEIS